MDNSVKKYQVIEIDNNDILPNRYQPRKKFEENEVLQLSESIKEHGLLNPIIVRKLGNKYELVAGERRYKANILAGNNTIHALVMDVNDKESSEIAVVENIQRKELNAIEEAISYKRILDLGNITQEQLAQKIGKSQSYVANKMRLLKLSDEVKEALLEKQISERHARSLLRLENNNDQTKMLERIINERLTVRKVDEEIEKMNNGEIVNNNLNNNINTNNFQGVSTNSDFINNIPEVPEIPTEPIVSATEPIINSQPLSQNNTAQVENNNIYPYENVSGLNNNMESSNILAVNTNPIENNLNPFANVTNPSELVQSNSIPQENNIAQPEVNINPFTNPVNETSIQNNSMLQGIGQPQSNLNSFNNLSPELNSIQNNQIPQEPNIEQTNFNSQPTIQENYSQPVNNINQEPSMNSLDSNIPPFANPTYETPIQNTSIGQEENPLNSNNQSFNLNNSFEDQDSLSQNITNNFSFNTDPIVEQQDEEPLANEMPEELGGSIFNQQQNNIGEASNQRPIIVNDYNTDFNPVMPEQAPTGPTVDFREIINIVRRCSSEIEKYGYKIETEEYDLDDLYQVVFKINK